MSTGRGVTGGRGVGASAGGGKKQDRPRLSGKFGKTAASATANDASSAAAGAAVVTTAGGEQLMPRRSSPYSVRRGVLAANTCPTRRVWVRDTVDSMRWRPGCLVTDGEVGGVASSSASGGGSGASETAASGLVARLDDGSTQVRRDFSCVEEFLEILFKIPT